MPLKARDPDCNDCKVIECAWCGECVNGRSFWILHDTHEVLCEECVILHNLKRPPDAN
jgi:hypothetical protein